MPGSKRRRKVLNEDRALERMYYYPPRWRAVPKRQRRPSLLERFISTGVEPPKVDFWESVGIIIGSIFAYVSYAQYGEWFPKPWENFALFLSVLMTTTIGFWALYSLLDKTETIVPGWVIWIMLGTSFGNWYYRTFGVIPYVFEDALNAMRNGIRVWTDFAALLCFIIILFLDLVMVYNILTKATPLVRK